MYVISDCGECFNDGYSCYHQCACSVYCYDYDISMLFQIVVNALMMAIPAIINVLVVCIVMIMISLCYFRLW